MNSLSLPATNEPFMKIVIKLSRLFAIVLWSVVSVHPLASQHLFLPSGHQAQELADRLTIKSPENTAFHTPVKPYSREALAVFTATALDADSAGMFTRRDREDIRYLAEELFPYLDSSNLQILSDSLFASRKPLLRYFYREKAALWHYRTPDLQVVVNPILDLGFGRDLEVRENILRNTRGASLSGIIDNRVYLYTAIYENQQNFLSYMDRWIQKYQTVPGQGLVKGYENEWLGIYGARDYLNATGYVGLNLTRHIDVNLGHGKFFIGNGVRSLLLSDYSNYYLYLNLNTRYKRFHYFNLFAELKPLAINANYDYRNTPHKFLAAHYLNFRVSPRFEVGLFEATVLFRDQQFDIQYLNPVILYRAVEHQVTSVDNVLIGLNVKLDLWRSVRLYGQFILDEFKFSHIVEQNGWWANKYGFQLGMKYIDVAGIDHLDLQTEINLVRPYTYSHGDSLNSYTHTHQPLAHPLYANFYEGLVKADYRPDPRWHFSAWAVFALYGEDAGSENWGGNPLLSYSSRVMDFGNTIAQGHPVSTRQFRLSVAYQFFHNGFFEVNGIYHAEDREGPDDDFSNFYAGTTVRVNY
jgi:hypothetical protein